MNDTNSWRGLNDDKGVFFEDFADALIGSNYVQKAISSSVNNDEGTLLATIEASKEGDSQPTQLEAEEVEAHVLKLTMHDPIDTTPTTNIQATHHATLAPAIAARGTHATIDECFATVVFIQAACMLRYMGWHVHNQVPILSKTTGYPVLDDTTGAPLSHDEGPYAAPLLAEHGLGLNLCMHPSAASNREFDVGITLLKAAYNTVPDTLLAGKVGTGNRFKLENPMPKPQVLEYSKVLSSALILRVLGDPNLYLLYHQWMLKERKIDARIIPDFTNANLQFLELLQNICHTNGKTTSLRFASTSQHQGAFPASLLQLPKFEFFLKSLNQEMYDVVNRMLDTTNLGGISHWRHAVMTLNSFLVDATQVSGTNANLL